MKFGWRENNYVLYYGDDPKGFHSVLAEIKYRGNKFNYYIKRVPLTCYTTFPASEKLQSPVQGATFFRKDAVKIVEDYYASYR